tara:strand:+ start:21 stop:164 length:144 start_codon:yes stop_codon:yes gene_type:complete
LEDDAFSLSTIDGLSPEKCPPRDIKAKSPAATRNFLIFEPEFYDIHF